MFSTRFFSLLLSFLLVDFKLYTRPIYFFHTISQQAIVKLTFITRVLNLLYPLSCISYQYLKITLSDLLELKILSHILNKPSLNCELV